MLCVRLGNEVVVHTTFLWDEVVLEGGGLNVICSFKHPPWTRRAQDKENTMHRIPQIIINPAKAGRLQAEIMHIAGGFDFHSTNNVYYP